MVVIMPSIIMTSGGLHAINLCCTIIGLSYTMTAQHKSNMNLRLLFVLL